MFHIWNFPTVAFAVLTLALYVWGIFGLIRIGFFRRKPLPIAQPTPPARDYIGERLAARRQRDLDNSPRAITLAPGRFGRKARAKFGKDSTIYTQRRDGSPFVFESQIMHKPDSAGETIVFILVRNKGRICRQTRFTFPTRASAIRFIGERMAINA